MLAVIWGGPLLRVLKHFKIGKQIRVEEPDRHIVKMGTPTMGGSCSSCRWLSDHPVERSVH